MSTYLTPEQRQLLNRFSNNLEDHPIEPTDAFYYPFLEMTDDDPIEELAGQIRFSQSQSVSLFTGQIGSGKSTEFRRLQQLLKDNGCEVFLIDMREYMNLTTPVEISDFLISLMAGFSEHVEMRFKKSPHESSYLQRLGKVLTQEVILGDVDVAGIKASLRDDPDFKQQLQQRLRGHATRIVKDAQNYAQDVVELIRKETNDPNKKVAILVDSVEQLTGVGVEGAIEVYKSVENLFTGHANSLQIPTLHIVYTIPPYLTALAQGLGRRLGNNLVCSLPSVHVQSKDEQADLRGLVVMREIIQRRCAEWRTIFSVDQLDTLAKASGGDVRDFFRLIRNSLIKASFGHRGGIPVQDAIIEQSLNKLRREMLPLAEDDRLWLREIADQKQANLKSKDKLPDFARFFDCKLVLNYRNGEDWYDVHPLIRDEVRR